MKKKASRIIAGLTGLLLLLCVLFCYNAFCGNPVSGMIAKSRIDRYIADTYPQKDYRVSNVSYDFKTSRYSCAVTDPDSPDGCFAATFACGTVSDSYETDVLYKGNTIQRLDEGFRDAVNPIIRKHLDTGTDDGNEPEEFGYGALQDADAALVESRLYPDMPVNAENMPLPTLVTVCLRTDDAASLIRVQQLARNLQVSGYRIDAYSFGTSDEYYENVPTEALMSAKTPEELKPYRL